MDYFREIANNYKFQLSAAISFGAALYMTWRDDADTTKTAFTILFLFALCMFVVSLVEKCFFMIWKWVKRHNGWNSLTPEEMQFVSYYVTNNTKTRYVIIYNGTYQDSGIINPLISKGILYRASNQSEFRGDSWMTAEQYFPFNINDKAFSFFKKKLSS